MLNMDSIRLPRALEDHRLYGAVQNLLRDRCRPLYAGSEICVPVLEWSDAVERSMRAILAAGRVCRGLEGAEDKLKAEMQGLRALQKKTGAQQAGRVSRMLLTSNDGSRRFYHDVEKIIDRYSPRVMCCRINVESGELGDALYGKGAAVKCIMADHKDAVVRVLLACVA